MDVTLFASHPGSRGLCSPSVGADAVVPNRRKCVGRCERTTRLGFLAPCCITVTNGRVPGRPSHCAPFTYVKPSHKVGLTSPNAVIRHQRAPNMLEGMPMLRRRNGSKTVPLGSGRYCPRFNLFRHKLLSDLLCAVPE